ncbi:MAG: DUF1192 domain-containing protein [Dongiaceae bacterium]
MDIEELEPRKKPYAPRDLDRMSIEELQDYIVSLEAEIARVKAKVDAKKAHLAGAAGLFKTGD